MADINLTKISGRYLLERPALRSVFRKGLINYSSLARQIIKDLKDQGLGEKNFDAIVVALRRYYDKVSRDYNPDSKILNLLNKSNLEVRNKVMVVVISKGYYYELIEDIQKKAKQSNELFHVIEGVNAVTIISNEEYAVPLKLALKSKIQRLTKGLVEVIIRSPESLEDIPGVMGLVYSILAENNINIVETMSCWTDTIIIINQQDLSEVMNLLSF